MLMLGGKVMMDRNAPEALRDTPQSSYDQSKALLEKWHGRGRALYAITPRFAITSSHEQMEMAEALAREFPDNHIQTHVDENLAEIEFARELFPNLPDYLGIYERYHLLGPKTLLGHCIHLTHRECEVLAATRSVAVWCPTSNLFIGSGGSRWRPISAAAPAIPCCARWTRATRCCNCAASGSIRCAPSTWPHWATRGR